MARKQAFPGNQAGNQDGHEDDEAGSDGFDDGPSKSELKRQDQDLRAIGVELVGLPLTELEAMALPEKLNDAVMACRKITAHGARLRQEMYIAKVLRGVDVEPIRETLARRSEVDRQRVRREHLIEQWRDRLLADEPAAWTELATLIDPSLLQPLRSLARQARAEHASERPPAASRQLFRRLREALEKPPV
jgi:ribosome-associated protein